MNDMLMEIISLKNHHLPSPLDVKASYVFQMALYDLDAFRAHIFGRGLLDNLQLSPAKLAAAKKNDIELLKLGHNWVKQELFSLK